MIQRGRPGSITMGRLAAFGAVVIWGVSFVATKAALRDLSPVTLIFGRFALGTAVLFLIVKARGESFVPPVAEWPALARMGFVGVFVHQMLQAHGLALTTAVNTGWLIGLIPIWSALLSALVLKERFEIGKAAGIALGAVGALVVITRGDLTSNILGLPTTRGDVLILASTLNWAIYTILGRRTLLRLGSTRSMAFSMFLGCLMFTPFFLYAAGWREFIAMSWMGLGALIFLGIGASGLGYLFWYAALERIETSQVAAFLYIEPLATLLAAVALLGEPFAVSTAIGGGIVLAGVFMVQRS